MPREKRVRDLMIPVAEYATVSAGAVVDGEAAVRDLRPVSPDQSTLLAEVPRVNAELLARYLELRSSLPHTECGLERK